METLEVTLADAAATEALGGGLAACCPPGCTIYLYGDLGAGKTTLVRGFLRALGHVGAVKSPTYTLVETYESLPLPVHHFDLYRLGDPEELEYLGIRDYFDGQGVSLVEWAQRGEGVLPRSDLNILLTYTSPSGLLPGRKALLSAHSPVGAQLLGCLRR